jgi:cytokinin dehydrogenase
MSRPPISRRTLLQGTLAATVTGFLPACRSWTTRPAPDAVPLPKLQGSLLTDEPSRQNAATDFGNLLHRTPWAVLVPGSAEDIVAMVRFARAQRLKVAAARGLGESHSYFGQSQVEGGIVIDMSALSHVDPIQRGDTSVWVEAGARWVNLVKTSTLVGLSPPTLTDYLPLSIGGTLSVGGIGGQTFRSGLQVDNVLELDVITGTGEQVRCSPSQQPELFDAVRGGLGQCGIIVRARLKLVEVPPFVRAYTLTYGPTELSRFLEDQRWLVEDGRFDYLEGFVELNSGKKRTFELNAVKYFAPGAEPDNAKLLQGLPAQCCTMAAHDIGYLDFVNRLEQAWSSAELRRAHPWIDLFVPDEAVESFVSQVLDTTAADDVGDGEDIAGRGFILLYAIRPSVIQAPFARVPAGKTAFLFSMLRSLAPENTQKVQRILQKNTDIFRELTAVGGKRYGAGSIQMSPNDWRQHFSPHWERFEQAKRAFDPDNLLTPGQGIF